MMFRFRFQADLVSELMSDCEDSSESEVEDGSENDSVLLKND